MLREMTPEQLWEWIAFSELEPFSPERADKRAGSIVQAINNVHRDRDLRPQPYTLEESTVAFGDVEAAVRPKTDWRIMKAIGQATAMSSQQQTEVERQPRVRKHR